MLVTVASSSEGSTSSAWAATRSPMVIDADVVDLAINFPLLRVINAGAMLKFGKMLLCNFPKFSCCQTQFVQCGKIPLRPFPSVGRPSHGRANYTFHEFGFERFAPCEESVLLPTSLQDGRLPAGAGLFTNLFDRNKKKRHERERPLVNRFRPQNHL